MTDPAQSVRRIEHGSTYEDFELGRVFDHHWGRTIRESDNTLFCALTMQYSPLYTNVEYARALNYADIPVHPLFLWNLVAGLSVEDLTEGGGPFLGLQNVEYFGSVYPGDTIYASSEVVARRLSDSRPGWGIVTWRTTGRNQRGELVIRYERTNLSRCRAAEGAPGSEPN